jgi:hypothetical protein
VLGLGVYLPELAGRDLGRGGGRGSSSKKFFGAGAAAGGGEAPIGGGGTADGAGGGILLVLGGGGMLPVGGTLVEEAIGPGGATGPAVITGLAGLRERAKSSGRSYGDL